MLKRKGTTPKSASNNGHRNGKPAKAPKAAAPAGPVRRRFVISSKAIKPEAPKAKGAAPVVPAPKPPVTGKQLLAGKQPANGGTPPTTPTVSLTSVDLTETIKTLVHLGQEHGDPGALIGDPSPGYVDKNYPG